MSHSDKMAELCEGIAQVLEEKGHTTKVMLNGQGNVCLLGAGRLAQGSPIVNGPQSSFENYAVQAYDNHSVDLNTAEALGFDEPQKVAEHNDGYVVKTRKTMAIPIPVKAVWLENDPAVVFTAEEAGFQFKEVIEETVYPPINQQQAIDLAMDRAKYWRNQ